MSKSKLGRRSRSLTKRLRARQLERDWSVICKYDEFGFHPLLSRRAVVQASFAYIQTNCRRLHMAASNQEVIEMLALAYSMEIETVMNYLANSVNMDGVRAEEIKKSLAADVIEELGHAQMLGQRIKQLGGLVPGSLGIKLGNQ